MQVQRTLHIGREPAGPQYPSHLCLPENDGQAIQQWTKGRRADIYTVFPAYVEGRGRNKSLKNLVQKRVCPIALRAVDSSCQGIWWRL